MLALVILHFRMTLPIGNCTQSVHTNCCCSHCQHCSCSFSHSTKTDNLSYSTISSTSSNVYEWCAWHSCLFRFASPDDEQPWSAVAFLTDTQFRNTSPRTPFLPLNCRNETSISPQQIVRQKKSQPYGDNVKHHAVDAHELINIWEESFIVPNIQKMHRRCSLSLDLGAFERDHAGSQNVNNKRFIIKPTSKKNRARGLDSFLNFATVTVRTACELHRCRDANIFIPYHRYAKVKLTLPSVARLCVSDEPAHIHEALTVSKVSSQTRASLKVRDFPFSAPLNYHYQASLATGLNSTPLFPNALFSKRVDRPIKLTALCSYVLEPTAVQPHSPQACQRYQRSLYLKMGGKRKQRVSSCLEECLRNKYTQTDDAIVISLKSTDDSQGKQVAPLMTHAPLLAACKGSKMKNKANYQWESDLLDIFEDEANRHVFSYHISPGLWPPLETVESSVS